MEDRVKVSPSSGSPPPGGDSLKVYNKLIEEKGNTESSLIHEFSNKNSPSDLHPRLNHISSKSSAYFVSKSGNARTLRTGELNATQTPRHIEFHLYRRRYLMLTLFSLCSIANATVWIPLSPISTAVKNAYDVDLTQINIESLLYMILYVPFNFPANYAIDYYGLRLGVTIGIGSTALGTWLKSFIDNGFYWIYVG